MALASITDALKKILVTEDTNAVLKIEKESERLIAEEKYDDAFAYIEEGIQLAKKNNYPKGLVLLKKKLGYIYIAKGQYKSAIKIYASIIPLAINNGFVNTIPLVYNMQGAAYYFNGEYLLSIEAYYNAIAAAKKVKNTDIIVAAYNGIANNYYEQKNYLDAIIAYKQALNLSKNMEERCSVYQNLGNCFVLLENQDSALVYFNQSLAGYKKLQSDVDISYTLSSIATIYMDKKEYTKALSLLKEAYSYLDVKNNQSEMIVCLLNMAQVYEEQNQFTLSLKKANEAHALVKQIDSKEYAKLLYERYSSIYAKLKKYDLAYQYHVKFTALKDTLLNEANSKAIAEIKTNYETEQKQVEIQRLNFENQSKELLIERQNTQRYLLLGLVFCAVVIAFIVYRQYVNKQKINNELMAKNTAIEEQRKEIQEKSIQLEYNHKEITDSISYARQIQLSLLPKNNYINRLLSNNYFILYKPKAVVSGDFYFVTEKNNAIYIAVVDCTGHGVPGAFMSVIGHNLLNQIINDRGIKQPAEILNLLHVGVRRVLGQDNENTDSRDGMDIALIAWNKKENTIEYAGANRSLYVVREGDIVEYKSDKNPIGGMQTEDTRRFTNRQIAIQTNDMVYMFSDGYADQFGGPKGKKFMLKKLMQTFVDIHQKDCVEQKKCLDDTFAEWKGDQEQIDDILVMGIRMA